jgi:hypothetical protein
MVVLKPLRIEISPIFGEIISVAVAENGRICRRGDSPPSLPHLLHSPICARSPSIVFATAVKREAITPSLMSLQAYLHLHPTNS